MKQRILLTGKNGQLGFELQRALAPLGELVAIGAEECDLADVHAIRSLVRDVRPRIIVNAAAYTDVDRAEKDVDLATAVNATAPGILGEEAARIGAWVLHYSTDYVFDGDKAGPYVETDATRPLNVYGLSKRGGEVALQESGAQHLILRSAWMLGAHGDNFARTILRLAAEKSSLDVVADQVGAPTSAALLADHSARLVAQAEQEGDDFPFGLYHVTSMGETNWCDYARFIVAEALAAGKPLELAPDAIHAILAADYPMPAIRPHNSLLDTEKFRTTFGLPLPDWQSGVRQVLRGVLSE